MYLQVPVFIRTVFLKVGEIDTIKETFSADVYIQARWREPLFDNQIDLVRGVCRLVSYCAIFYQRLQSAGCCAWYQHNVRLIPTVKNSRAISSFNISLCFSDNGNSQCPAFCSELKPRNIFYNDALHLLYSSHSAMSESYGTFRLQRATPPV